MTCQKNKSKRLVVSHEFMTHYRRSNRADRLVALASKADMARSDAELMRVFGCCNKTAKKALTFALKNQRPDVHPRKQRMYHYLQNIEFLLLL